MAQEDYPQIPAGGGGGAPLGPGAMVANNLQQILAQRRAEKQQELINQLSQQKMGLDTQNIQSEIATRAEQAASQKEIREAAAEARKQAAADKASTQKRLQAVSDYASQQYPVDQTENNMWRMIEADPEKGQQLFNAIMTKKMGESDNTATPWVYDEKNDKWTQAPAGVVGKKGEVIKRTYPPNPPQPTAAVLPQLFQREEIDPADLTKTHSVSYWLKPGEQPNEKNMIPGGIVRKGNVANTPAGAKPPHISDKTWQEFLGAKQAYDKDPSNANAASMRDNVIKKVVAEYPATPDVKDFVNTTWMKPAARNMAPAQIIAGMKPTPNPQEAQQITELWGLLSGK